MCMFNYVVLGGYRNDAWRFFERTRASSVGAALPVRLGVELGNAASSRACSRLSGLKVTRNKESGIEIPTYPSTVATCTHCTNLDLLGALRENILEENSTRRSDMRCKWWLMVIGMRGGNPNQTETHRYIPGLWILQGSSNKILQVQKLDPFKKIYTYNIIFVLSW